MAAVSTGGLGLHDRLFASVFTAPVHTTPTPEATPNIGTLQSPGQPFGGFVNVPAVVDATIRRAQAWSTATHFLALPPGKPRQLPNAPVSPPATDALRLLLVLDTIDGSEDLVEWYSNEVRIHFQREVLPDLHQWQITIPAEEATEVIENTTSMLMKANVFYAHAINLVLAVDSISPDLRSSLLAMQYRVWINVHTLVLHSIPHQRLLKTLSSAMYNEMHRSLSMSDDPIKCRADDFCHCDCSIDRERLNLDQMRSTGLGGTIAQRALGHAVHRLLRGPLVQRKCLQVDWFSQRSVVPMLRGWMESRFIANIEQSFKALWGPATVSDRDFSQWGAMAVEELGRSRTAHLFDFVKSWPQSMGGILDIKAYITTPAAKANVCTSFEIQVQTRLLHAGATTAEILGFYVNVINVFRTLDPRGVLLEKVAAPIKAYLRGRDDTVKIIAASFLAEVNADGSVPSEGDAVCADISREVEQSGTADTRDHKSLDWDNLDWVPDPIDAGPDWKSSKTEDVIAHVLGLFEPTDFLKEIQIILGEHLLQATDTEYEKETRLIELFKSRFGQDKLQACEVMLKDMRDSLWLERKIKGYASRTTTSLPTPNEIRDAIPEDGITIQGLYAPFRDRIDRDRFMVAVRQVANKRKDLFFAKRMLQRSSQSSAWSEGPRLNAQVISSAFWPDMNDSSFSLPQPVENLQARYDEGFGRLKGQQKLRWRPALGRVKVELQFEDRTVTETVPASFASVVYAFQQAPERDGDCCMEADFGVSLTIAELEEILSMDEDVLRPAIHYWTAKRVLVESSADTITVIETLPPDSDSQALPVEESAAAGVTAMKSQDAVLQEERPKYEAFITSMLTNQGPKQPSDITFMMKMVMPNFTHGDDEVKWLLGNLVKQGIVLEGGEIYSIAK